MNKEQLTRANELAERIEKLETQLVGWKHVAGLRTTVLRCSLINSNQLIDLSAENIDIQIVRALAINKIETELEALKVEFDNL